MGSDVMKSVEAEKECRVSSVDRTGGDKRQVSGAMRRGRRPAGARYRQLISHQSALVTGHSTLVTRLAFTLIELLVVIAIMAVLAALIIPITGAVTRHKLRSRTKTEMRLIENAIEDYKTKKGYYPPDNPGIQFGFNELYYELSGTTVNGTVYTTMDGNTTIGSSII